MSISDGSHLRSTRSTFSLPPLLNWICWTPPPRTKFLVTPLVHQEPKTAWSLKIVPTGSPETSCVYLPFCSEYCPIRKNISWWKFIRGVVTLNLLTISWQSPMCFRSSAISGDQSPLEIEWVVLIRMLILTRQTNLVGNHDVFCFAVILVVFRAAKLSAESDVYCCFVFLGLLISGEKWYIFHLCIRFTCAFKVLKGREFIWMKIQEYTTMLISP